MDYVNPFELLQIKLENLSQIDETTLKKAKKKLLSEIELGDAGTIKYHSLTLTKSDCLRIIDELNNRDKKEFHFFVFQNKSLRDFITEGKIDFFENYKVESIYKTPGFLDFISPFFSEKYNKILVDNFKAGQTYNVTKILSIKPITNDSYIDKCYINTYIVIREIDAELNQIIKDIDNGNNNPDEEKLNLIHKAISDKINVTLLNSLPSYFQNIRNQLAQTVRDLAVIVNNEPYNHYSPAFKLIELAKNVLTDGLVSQTINKDYYIIKRNYDSYSQKEQYEKQTQQYSGTFTKYQNIISYIAQILEEITIGKSEQISKNFFGLDELLESCVRISELNSLPETFSKIRSVIALQMDQLSVVIWNNYQRFEPSFKLIQLSDTIKVDDETKVKIKTDFDILKGIGDKIKKCKTSNTSASSIGITTESGIKINDSKTKERISLGGVWAPAILIVIIVLFIVFIIVSVNSNNSLNEDNSTYTLPTNSYENNDNASGYSQPSNNYSKPDISSKKPDYQIVPMKNGNIYSNSLIKSKYDYKLDNKLIIVVGDNADVALKMINLKTGKCIRYVYINKNTTYIIKHIPQAEYYLKIAYGNDWGIKKGESISVGKFTKNALYERGTEILDYNLIRTNDGWQVPSFSLKLNVININEGSMDHFTTSSISSNDFYNE
jgi:hypothetical protein